MMLLFRNDDGVGSVCISDITFAERGKDVQIRLAATDSAVTPHVTILAASAANSLKPTRCSTVFGLVPMLAATAHSDIPHTLVRLAGEVSPPGRIRRCSRNRRSRQLRSKGFPVTAAVVPAGREEQYGSYDVDEGYHRRETIAAVAAVAVACRRRETSVVAAVAAAACHRRGIGVVAAAAAAACHRRGKPYRRSFDDLRLPRPPCPHHHGRRQKHADLGVPPAYPPPALVSQFHGPCVESRRNGWCSLVSSGSVGGRLKSLSSRYRKVPGAGGE